MALYHHDENHFDLLVKTDSRIAQEGFVTNNINGALESDEKLLIESHMETDIIETIDEETKITAPTDDVQADTDVVVPENENTDEKNHNCIDCKLIFSNSDALEKHMYTHKDTQEESCSICDFKCKSKSELNTHSETHTSPMYTCTQCDFKSRNERELNKHIKNEQVVRNSHTEWNCDDCCFGLQ